MLFLLFSIIIIPIILCVVILFYVFALAQNRSIYFVISSGRKHFQEDYFHIAC